MGDVVPFKIEILFKENNTYNMINYPNNTMYPTTPPALEHQSNVDGHTHTIETDNIFNRDISDGDVVDQLYFQYNEIYGESPQDRNDLMNWIVNDLIPALHNRFAEQEQPLNTVATGWDAPPSTVAVNLDAQGWEQYPPITTDDLTDGQ
jgi:hypothetical protein